MDLIKSEPDSIFSEKDLEWDQSSESKLGDGFYLDKDTGVCLKLTASDQDKLVVVDIVPAWCTISNGNQPNKNVKKFEIVENTNTFYCVDKQDVEGLIATFPNLSNKCTGFLGKLGSTLLSDLDGYVCTSTGEKVNAGVEFPDVPDNQKSYSLALGNRLRGMLSREGLATQNGLNIPLKEVLFGTSSKTKEDSKLLVKAGEQGPVLCNSIGKLVDGKGKEVDKGVNPMAASKAFEIGAGDFESWQINAARQVMEPKKWDELYWKGPDDLKSLMLVIEKTEIEGKTCYIFRCPYTGQVLIDVIIKNGVTELVFGDDIDKAKKYKDNESCDFLGGLMLTDTVYKDLKKSGKLNRYLMLSKNRWIVRGLLGGVIVTGGVAALLLMNNLLNKKRMRSIESKEGRKDVGSDSNMTLKRKSAF